MWNNFLQRISPILLITNIAAISLMTYSYFLETAYMGFAIDFWLITVPCICLLHIYLDKYEYKLIQKVYLNLSFIIAMITLPFNAIAIVNLILAALMFYMGVSELGLTMTGIVAVIIMSIIILFLIYSIIDLIIKEIKKFKNGEETEEIIVKEEKILEESQGENKSRSQNHSFNYERILIKVSFAFVLVIIINGLLNSQLVTLTIDNYDFFSLLVNICTNILGISFFGVMIIWIINNLELLLKKASIKSLVIVLMLVLLILTILLGLFITS